MNIYIWVYIPRDAYTHTLHAPDFSDILMSILLQLLICKQNLSKKICLKSYMMIENWVCYLKDFPKGLMV